MFLKIFEGALIVISITNEQIISFDLKVLHMASRKL